MVLGAASRMQRALLARSYATLPFVCFVHMLRVLSIGASASDGSLLTARASIASIHIAV